MIVDSANNIGPDRQCHEKRQKHITFKKGQCLKMLLHLKSNNSSSKQDAKFDGTDGSWNCKIDV